MKIQWSQVLFLKAFKILAASLCLILVVALQAQVSSAADLAQVAVSASGVTAQAVSKGVTFLSLRIKDPQGNLVYDLQSNGTPINWNLSEESINGLYSWEAKASNATRRTERTQEARPSFLTWSSSGSFSVTNNAIVPLEQNEQGLLQSAIDTLMSITSSIGDYLLPSAYADNVILDDQIVTGSECVGQDCVNGESFGFDTIRLKENNLRIKFQDTSNSSSFPSNDWQITINDSSNGGNNKFSIDDIDSGKTPFTIEASAPSNSLYVEDAGRIGLGTATPVVELHVVDGDTPTLRLEQDGSSGFTPQTWDIASNETNFFIRDATNGSQLPFKIRPGADSNSLYIDADNDIGIGTASPIANLHIWDTDTAPGLLLKIEAAGNAEITDTLFNITAPVGSPTPAATEIFTVAGNGDMYVLGNLDVASSRSLKKDIIKVNGKEAIDALEQLEPVHFSYKTSPNTRSMGFIAEDVPDIVATKERKTLRSMDLVALLTKVTQEQQKTIKALSAKLEVLEEQMATVVQ